MRTVWVLGDQLNRSIGAMAEADPSTHRVLMVESTAKLASKRWHRQRAHLVLTSMRRSIARHVRAAERLSDGAAVRERAVEVHDRLDRGAL